jgi:HEAT repeat protein
MIPEKRKMKSVSSSDKMTKETSSSPESLIVTLSSHNDAIRVKGRQGLVAMGKVAVPLLTDALKNKSYLMRWEAAKALGEIADPGAAPALVEALEDEEFDVRWLAAEGLVRINIKSLRPLLHALMERGDSEPLREGAHHVIHDLTKGALKKYLAPLHAALNDVEPPMEVPWAAKRALEELEKDMRL